MTKTQNLELDLLEKTDPVDFNVLNGNMEKLDAAVGEAAAKANAAWSAENPCFVTGRYVGNGGSPQNWRVEIGFRPRVIFIYETYGQTYCTTGDSVFVGDCNIEWDDTGFRFTSGRDCHPNRVVPYYYVAFK